MPLESCEKYTATLSEILALTPVVQTIADATDVPGVRLEWMNGAWYGDCGFPSADQHAALLAAGAYNSLALNARATVNGQQVTWRGQGGWVVSRPGQGSDQSNRLAVRAAISKAIAGVSDFRFLSQGDSISAGYGLSSASQHFSYALAKILAAKTGVPMGEGWIWLSQQGAPASLSTISVGAGWSLIGGNPVYRQTTQYGTNSTATSIDITFSEIIDGVNVMSYQSAGTSGYRYSWNGGTKTVISNTETGNLKYVNTYIAAPSRGTHTLNLWAPTSGGIMLAAVEPQDSTMKKIRFSSSGVSGKCIADLDSVFVPSASNHTSPDAMNIGMIDLFAIEIGTNDQVKNPGYTSGETWKDYVRHIVAQVNSRARKIGMVLVSPTDTVQSSGFTPTTSDFVNYGISVASELGITHANMQERFVAHAESFARGLLQADGIHPATAGAPEYASGILDSVLP